MHFVCVNQLIIMYSSRAWRYSRIDFHNSNEHSSGLKIHLAHLRFMERLPYCDGWDIVKVLGCYPYDQASECFSMRTISRFASFKPIKELIF